MHSTHAIAKPFMKINTHIIGDSLFITIMLIANNGRLCFFPQSMHLAWFFTLDLQQPTTIEISACQKRTLADEHCTYLLAVTNCCKRMQK